MIKFIFLLCGLLLSHTTQALDLPKPLQEWQQWVLHKHPQAHCSFQWNKFEQKFCAWPSTLALRVEKDGMHFEQRWQVEAGSWLTLPGSKKYWPTAVMLADRPQPVIERGGRPATYMQPGKHTLKGFIPWTQRPENVPVTPSAALVTLTVDGKAVAVPTIDATGKLWLRSDADAANSTSEASAPTRVQVFRKLIDGVPLKLETELRLRISGAARELQLGRALPEGFELMSVASPLPARLEKDGRLRVQVRQGSWTIKLTARNTLPNNSFTVLRMDELWPPQEIWVFENRPSLRAVTVAGVNAIDPQQTNLPENWRKLPAYLLSPKEQLVLQETSRGDATPAPDRLTLQRDMWLDFDGGGATLKDKLSGELNQPQRLQTLQPFELGRAEVDSQPQLITTLSQGESGLEVAQGNIDLQAVSRIETSHRQWSAVGWNHGVDSLQTVLHLPPGWQLFAVQGADYAPTTWVAKWSLFDIFLLLVISSALLRLFGKSVGLLALLTLLITFHEAGAPNFIWLNLALTLALLRVITRGRMQWLLTLWRNITALGLLLVSLLFAVQQLQQAVYPMLEKNGHVNAPVIYAGSYAKRQGEVAEEVAFDGAAQRSSMQPLSKSAPPRTAPLKQQYDTDASIQTGPGVPTWSWHSAVLRWSGPVVEQQQLQLYLLSPTLTRILKLAGVILLVLLIASLVRHPSASFGRWSLRGKPASLSVTVGICLLAATLLPSPAVQAQVPDAALLQQLEQRLLEPPPCAPSCATISQAQVRIAKDTLTVELSIDALAQVAVPLPAQRGVWLPQQVRLNDAANSPLLNNNGVLKIAVPVGRSNVVLRGKLHADELRLPLTANNVSVEAPGWRVTGLLEGRVPSGSLQLQKEQRSNTEGDDKSLLPNPIAPFVGVHRVLRLGVDWYVDTHVWRVAPHDAAINLTVPLLPGEQLLSDTLKQVDGAVQVSLQPGQKTMNWRSSLDKTDTITLTAAAGNDWYERWRLVSDTRWHVEWSGLAPVKQKSKGAQINPLWQPRPGESLQFNVQKPLALPGASQTIEQVRLTARPGVRRSAVELTLQLRAGHASSYQFNLPETAQLQSILLDGEDYPLPADAHRLSLPLHPGVQELQLQWQSPEPMQLRTATPALDIGLPATNINLEMAVPAGRWLLFVSGPSIGPAMLVWGVLLVIIAVSVLLGRLAFLPLRTWEWLLLGIGLSTINAYGAALMVAWFFAMHARGALSASLTRRQFNGMQVLLAALTLIAFVSLLGSIPWGLLGSPDMQIAGNGSSSSVLYWYQDHSAQQLPQGWIFSLPIWIYRSVLLLWSLWLAFAVIKWLQWAWQKYSYRDVWKASSKIVGDEA